MSRGGSRGRRDGFKPHGRPYQIDPVTGLLDSGRQRSTRTPVPPPVVTHSALAAADAKLWPHAAGLQPVPKPSARLNARTVATATRDTKQQLITDAADAREWRLAMQQLRMNADLKDAQYLNADHKSRSYWQDEQTRIDAMIKHAKSKIDASGCGGGGKSVGSSHPAARSDDSDESDSNQNRRRSHRARTKRDRRSTKSFLKAIYAVTDGNYKFSRADPGDIGTERVNALQAWKNEYRSSSHFKVERFRVRVPRKKRDKHDSSAKREYHGSALHSELRIFSYRPRLLPPWAMHGWVLPPIQLSPLGVSRPSFAANRPSDGALAAAIHTISSASDVLVDGAAGAGFLFTKTGATQRPGTALLRTAMVGVTGLSGRTLPVSDQRLTDHARSMLLSSAERLPIPVAESKLRSASHVTTHSERRLIRSKAVGSKARAEIAAEIDANHTRRLADAAREPGLIADSASGGLQQIAAPRLLNDRMRRPATMTAPPTREQLTQEFGGRHRIRNRRSTLERHLYRVSRRISWMTQPQPTRRQQPRTSAGHAREKRQPKLTAPDTKSDVDQLQAAIIRERLMQNVMEVGSIRPPSNLTSESVTRAQSKSRDAARSRMRTAKHSVLRQLQMNRQSSNASINTVRSDDPPPPTTEHD